MRHCCEKLNSLHLGRCRALFKIMLHARHQAILAYPQINKIFSTKRQATTETVSHKLSDTLTLEKKLVFSISSMFSNEFIFCTCFRKYSTLVQHFIFSRYCKKWHSYHNNCLNPNNNSLATVATQNLFLTFFKVPQLRVLLL